MVTFVDIVAFLGAAYFGVLVGAKRMSLANSLKIYAAVLAAMMVLSFINYRSLNFDTPILAVPILTAFVYSAAYWVAKWITDVVVGDKG